MREIFISYRRDDSAGYAGRIFDYLKAVFGPGSRLSATWTTSNLDRCSPT